jgi:acyl-CoA dehydrogenase
MVLLFIVAACLTFLALAYIRVPGWLWTIAAGLCLAGIARYVHVGPLAAIITAAVFATVALILNVTALRRALVSNHILAIYRRILPACRRPNRKPSTPAQCGGTATCSRASPIGKNY